MASRRSDASAEEKDTLINKKDGSPSTDSHENRDSIDSGDTSISSTSLVLENLNHFPSQLVVGKPSEPLQYRDDDSDPEIPRRADEDYGHVGQGSRMSRHLKRMVWVVSIVAVIGWSLALASFVTSGRYKHSSTLPFDHDAPQKSSGKQLSLSQVQHGAFQPQYSYFRWIDGANNEDGLIMEVSQPGKDFLVIEDVRSRQGDPNAHPSKTLMRSGWFHAAGKQIWADNYWPSPDFKKVLLLAKREQKYRHSFTGLYYIFDVQTLAAEPLDPEHADDRIQLAQWSPTSDSIVFTRDNNLYLRMISSTAVRQITQDGGPEFFYGIPDWAYEEEVFQGNSGTWFARDGQYVALLRTNETMVPEYPVQFFLSRPSNTVPPPGLENYPEVTKIKYPKAGAPNPFVEVLFYDVARNEIFPIEVPGGFPDEDRIVADVMWADGAKCLIRQLNRESDKIRMVLVDVQSRTSKVVWVKDVAADDGGWVEPGQTAKYVPADPENGRPQDGYIDMLIFDNNDHLAYFTPLDSGEPIMLTRGPWTVEHGELYTVDLEHNLLYFTAAKEAPTQRHVYSVDLKGENLTPIVPIDKPGYYGASFSARGGYALIVNSGPDVPSQKVISTPANSVQYEELLTDNKALAELAATYELPHKVFSTVEVDGFTLQVLERRPPHFDPKKKYPVLFYQYSGPGSQTVDRKFNIDFQSYVASKLGYIVVTVDGRGTGYSGRKHQCITRGEIGKYEATDQIATAKFWAAKPYVDADRIAIWGWSYGGFTTLKTLELDAGRTFKYGIAVAPVTDWRFYDSIYTERYMRTPQHNTAGYDRSAVTNATALAQNVRFMIMHGVADDNVHFQNTLHLIDDLDLSGVTNYDVHFFPDSNHNINFHGANEIVYEKIEKWLVAAFNGLWYKYENPVPEFSAI